MKGNHHPGLAELLDLIQDDENLYLVMEYVEGADLDTLLRRNGPMAPQEVVDIGHQVCDALMYLHSKPSPILYLDLKPSNIILRPDGSICLLDFGAAQTMADSKVRHPYFGTPGYAAPELYTGNLVDQRADIYSLGVVMYTLLCGHRKQTDPQDLVPPVGETVPELAGSRLEKTIARCCEKNPKDRWPDCKALAKELNSSYLIHVPGGTGKSSFIKKVTSFLKPGEHWSPLSFLNSSDNTGLDEENINSIGSPWNTGISMPVPKPTKPYTDGYSDGDTTQLHSTAPVPHYHSHDSSEISQTYDRTDYLDFPVYPGETWPDRPQIPMPPWEERTRCIFPFPQEKLEGSEDDTDILNASSIFRPEYTAKPTTRRFKIIEETILIHTREMID